jgi:signal transduction histidine kinase
VRAQRPPRVEPRQLTAGTAALALGVTLLVVVVTPLRFAYRAPELHLVLETAEGCIALAVAYLVAGRFREHRRWQELLLVLGLGVLAVTNLLLSAVPLALARDEELDRWAPLVVRLVGTVLVAAAALAPDDLVVRRGLERPVVLGSAAALVLLGLGGWWAGGSLPPVVDPAVDLSDTRRILLAGHPLVVGAQVLSGLLYAVAAACFTRRAGQDSADELMRWLGAGCVLAAVARVAYVLFPSLYSDFVHLGDTFRLGFYVCLLVGAAREVRSYWARAAVLEDRRRLARDLHDGLTQELTYLYAQAQRLQTHPEDRRIAEQIGGAAGRALDEARHAIGALTRPVDQAFADSLQQSVEDLGRRYDVRTATSIEGCVVVTPEQAEAILRITGEALRNAVRHGQAGCVTVGLTAEPLELMVEDDGRGFHPDGVVSRGFGLTSMRERAEGAGASYALTSADGDGTRVRVSWA